MFNTHIQILDDRMVRIDLQDPTASHELQARGVSKSLSLHQPAEETPINEPSQEKSTPLSLTGQSQYLSIFADQPNFPETSTQGRVRPFSHVVGCRCRQRCRNGFDNRMATDNLYSSNGNRDDCRCRLSVVGEEVAVVGFPTIVGKTV